jgi:hypothetical protein
MLSQEHKQAIITLKTIFKTLPILIKENKNISKYNETIISKYNNLARKQADEKYDNHNNKYKNCCEFDNLFFKYLNNEAPKEYKPYATSWLSLVPFLDHEKSTYGSGYYYVKTAKNKYGIWDNNIFLTLLHILYNRIKKKTRGHTKDDNQYIEKHKDLYEAICQRSEMQQFLLDNNNGTTNANSCS